MRYLKTYVILLLAALTALPLAAVTDKEMEEAKAITAKTYLRWANNGSGYLDEISVKSMSELTGKLRQKEKENLKAFNSVKVPSDYAGWDKNKLIEFWAVTFFTSPALDAHGKGAKSTVRKKLSEMKISAPAKEEPKAETPEPEAKPETETESSAEAGAVSDGDAQLPDAMPDAMPDASQAAEQQEQLLNDQQAIEKDAAEAEESARPQEQAHTWVYVLVLAILVAVVIWLVVYAANLMKRQPSEGDKERRERRRRDDDDDDDLREQTRKAISKKNDELEDVRRRLGEEESKNADLGMELEKLKLQCKHLNENLEVLRDENRRLRLGRGAGTAEAVAAGTVRPHREVVRETVRETVREAQPETRRESVQRGACRKTARGHPHTHGRGKANHQGHVHGACQQPGHLRACRPPHQRRQHYIPSGHQ